MTATGPAAAQEPENTLILELSTGRVVIEMRPDLAPRHVARIKELVREGFLRRHRLPSGHRRLHGPGRRPDGDRPRRLGQGRPSGGVLQRPPSCVARWAWRGPWIRNSANSQFFIMFAPASHLEQPVHVWGQVVEGMDAVDALPKGEPPREPGRIERATIAAGAPVEASQEQSLPCLIETWAGRRSAATGDPPQSRPSIESVNLRCRSPAGHALAPYERRGAEISGREKATQFRPRHGSVPPPVLGIPEFRRLGVGRRRRFAARRGCAPGRVRVHIGKVRCERARSRGPGPSPATGGPRSSPARLRRRRGTGSPNCGPRTG